ncbi:hypothetical protein DOTSEDRAFT_53246 [Dothistroma septosporum NZE10]|uniref:Uncharacterized protein n=1 Tax=Dothistroma septosporum (strain NZE10 / CBS 128990) TaxID=675120 RepID=N1PNL8_DOTSN|nr:hypothetical protein DOTSEDRAFT_53246 [Dothistroma septosporum NZE10]
MPSIADSAHRYTGDAAGRPLILSEDNCAERRRDIDIKLADQGLSHVANNKMPPAGMGMWHFKAKSWMAAKEVCERVSPCLLKCVSKKDRINAHGLLTLLRRLAQSLRFTGLPQDLRFCVYDHLEDLQPRLKRAHANLPAICHVKQELREETRETAIRHTTFKFYACREKDAAKLESKIRPWLEHVIRDDLDKLWQIRIDGRVKILILFGGQKVTVQNLRSRSGDILEDPTRVTDVRRACDEQIEMLQSAAGWASAVESPDCKSEAILEILRADEISRVDEDE